MKLLLRVSLLTLFFAFYNSALAVKLYWVGGSGNFNDPAHWSYTSGGVGGTKTPDANDDVYFDERSFSTNSLIQFVGQAAVHSLQFGDYTPRVTLSGSQNEKIYVGGELKLNSYVDNQFLGDIHLTANGMNIPVLFGLSSVKGNVYFEGTGSWLLRTLQASDNSTIYINGGKVKLDYSAINAGSILVNNAAVLESQESVLNAKNRLIFGGQSSLIDNGTYIEAPTDNVSNFDLGNNSVPQNRIINNNSPLSCAFTFTVVSQPKCATSCDGKVVFTIPATCAGTAGPPYTATWTNILCGAPAGTPATGLTAGTYTQSNVCGCGSAYTVIFRDNLGVFAGSSSVNIFAPSAIQQFYSSTPPSCNGGCNGKIFATIIGGTQPYTVKWTPGPTHNNNFGSDSIIGLCVPPSSYTIIVVDANNCTDTNTTTITQPTSVVPNGNSVAPTCFGICNGYAWVAPSGGTPFGSTQSNGIKYTTVWDGNAALNNDSLKNLCANSTHTCVVTDANGCTATFVVTIGASPPQITFTKNPLLGALVIPCNNTCNGSVGVTSVNGGVPGYTYTWTPAGGTVSNTSNSSTYSGLCGSVAGMTYTVVIKDANSCTVTTTYTITSPPALSNTITVVQPKCVAGQGSATGTATLTESGGVAPYTFTWVPGGTQGGVSPSSTFTGTPGSYTVNITDGNGCLDTANVTFTAPTGLSTTVTVTQPTCPNLNNGQMCVSASGGTGGYTYTWTPSAGSASCTPSTLTVTPGGSSVYTVTVKDANSCSVTVTGTLVSPPQATITPSVSNPPCAGTCNGSATLTPTGGIGPFAYQWSCVGTTTNTISGQCGGTTCNYTVTDQGTNCKYTGSVSFTVAPTLSVTVASTSLTCSYSCNSTLTATAAGGTPNYSYQWTGSGLSCPTCSVETNMCAGTYTVKVTDNLGCNLTKTVTVTGPAAMNNTVTVVNPKCVAGQGTSTGSATVTASGGTPAYTFTWSPGVTTGCSSPKTCGSNIPVGTYSVFVKDVNGCLDTATVTISPPTAVSGSITTTTNPTCPNLNNGQLCVTPSGGTPAYQYTWSPTGGNASCSAATLTVTSGGSSVYTVTIKDANQCTVTVTGTLTSPPQATVTSAVTNASCGSASCSATATLSPSGGTGPFSYSWSCTPATTPTITACAGTSCNYTVTDLGTGCKYTGSVTFAPAPPTMTVNISATALACAGDCSSTITSTVTGGTAPYTYSWTGTGANPVCTTCPTQTAMCAGSYTVQVTDSKGCTQTATVSVTSPPALTVTMNASQPTCSGICNGSITVTPTGGTPGYPGVSWSPALPPPNSATTFTATNLCGNPSTVYTVTITDQNGCTGTGTATITAPPSLTVSVNTTSVTCKGSCNGSATVTASGGTGVDTYSWDGGAFGASTSISGLCAGSHTVTVKDANSCTTSTIFNIVEPNPLTVATTQQNTCGPCTGSAGSQVNGGTPPYTYTWSPAGGNLDTATNLCVGNYTLTVGDANNCPTVSTTFTITTIVVINITTTSQSVSCNGACDGVAIATASSGLAPYNYTWTASPTYTTVTTCSSVASCTVNNICANTYYVVHAADQNGCTNQDSVKLVNPPVLTATATATNATCAGQCIGSATVTAGGGTAPYSYSWNTGATTPSISNLCPGVYTVTVTDNKGCTVVKTVTVSTNPSYTITSTTTTPVACAGTNGSITVTASGGTPTYTFTWTTGGTGTVTTTSPTSTLSGVPAGVYTVTISDQNGCDTTVQITLSDPGSATITATTQSVSCYGVCDGSATVTAVGTPTVNITWPATTTVTGTSPLTVTAQCAGVYSVKATDGNGCTAFQNVTINGPTKIFDSLVTKINPTCNGLGSITVTAGGGSHSYSYTWSPIGGNGPTASNLPAGTYTLEIADSGNPSCFQIFTYTLSPTSSPTLIVNATNPTCSGLSNATATASTSGGSPAYTYTWSSGSSGVISSGMNNTNVTGLGADVYTVSVTDNGGCTTQQTFTITSPAPIVSNLGYQNNLCNGGCTGTGTVTPTGGTGTISVIWQPGALTGDTVSGLCASSHSVTLTDQNGCTHTDTFTVTKPTAVSFTVATTDPLCSGAATGSATVTINGGTQPYQINWTGVLCPNCTSVSGLSPGSYTVDVLDSNNCAATAQIFTINNPSAVNLTSVTTDPSCLGSCNGSISVSTSGGGTAPFTFSWLPGGGTVTSTSTTSTYSNLCAGNYTVTATDANGCTASTPYALANPTPPNLTYVSNDAGCGQCNGSINITSVSGTGTVAVNWLPPSTCGSAMTCPNLCLGIYDVQLTDQNGCKDTVSVTISNSNGPKIDSVVVHNNCFGDSNGSITVTVTSGTNVVTPYTFSWTPTGAGTVTTTSASSTYSGLGSSPPIYISTVTDSLGCGTITSFSITNPSKITDNGNHTDATCVGINDGTITSSAQGGTPSMSSGVPTYTYVLDGSTTNTTGSFTGLAVGLHTVCISDSLNCQVCVTYSIAPVNTIQSQTTSVNVTCNGSCNGSASVSSVSGGTSPYVISWNDPNAQSTPTASNLCVGNYTATITDNNGCMTTQTVSIAQPPKLTVSASSTNPSCGQCNGTLTVTTSGGTPFSTGNYSYVWSPTGDTTPSIANVCAGVYQVHVTDSMGCVQSFPVPVSNSNAPTLTVTSTSPPCSNVCAGSATVTAGGGITPYTYSWPTNPGVTTNSISGQCGGLYFVQVKDSAGCIATDSVKITPSTSFTVSTTMTNPPCNVCTGVINSNVNGGSGTFNYSWSTGASTSSINNLCAGMYTLVVTDVPSGCKDTMLIGLNNNSNGPTLSFTSTNVLCNGGGCTGTATVSASGGAAPYSYQWSTGVNDTNATVGSLCPNNQYGVVVTDTNGCIQTGQVTITEPAALLASAPITNQPNCFGDCNGSIFTVISGGTPGYTYAWSPSSITGSSGTNLCAGNYSVMVTDTNGCTVSLFDTLIAPPQLVITGTMSPASCNNVSDGSISTTTSGGVPAYSWQWSGGSTATTSNLNSIPVGTYTIVATDAHSCTVTTNFTVISNNTVTVNAGNDTTACALNALVLNGTVNAGTTVQWVQLPIPPGTVIGTTPSVTITPSSGTTTQYILIGTNGGCSAVDTISVTSNPLPTPDAGQAVAILPSYTISIGGAPTNPLGGPVVWSPGSTLSDSTATNPVASPSVTTTYTVYETNSFGCTAMDTITITILPQFVIPNGFTPNGDGYNDFWQIDMINLFPDCEVEVFNRWGEPLFYSKGYNSPWNGTYKGKPVPVGTYYYLIRLHDKEKRFPEYFTGPLTIMR